MTRHLLPVVCAALLGLTSFGCTAHAERTGVLFYNGFNGAAEPTRGRGSVEWRSARQEAWKGATAGYALGKQGQALVSGDGQPYATYQAEGNLRGNRGTVEFWFCPRDWNGSDDKFHVFFEAQEPGWLVVYKYYNPAQLSGLFLASADKESWVTATHNFKDIKPGEWHHLAATWSNDEIKFYLDGKPSAATAAPRLPATLGGRFTVGDVAGLSGGAPPAPRDAHSLIDEFYIYDRPLTDDEVAWAYQHGADRAPGADLPLAMRRSVRVVSHLDPAGDQMQLEVHASGAEQFTGTASLRQDARLITAPVTMTGPGEGIATLQYADLAAGDYPVTVELRDTDGNSIGKTDISASLPGRSSWRGNKIGIPTTPPPPYTAVDDNGSANKAPSSISMWGRTYRLGANGLPVQITSGGANLLSGPVQLRTVRGGQNIAWTPGASRTVSSTSIASISQGSASSAIGTLNWKCTAEFDGMLRYDLTLAPDAGASVDTFELRVPMTDDHAGLEYLLQPPVKNSNWSRGLAQATPRQQGTIFQSSWLAYWWLGDENRGLAGFCESDEAWDRVNRADGFRIERNNGTVEAVWSFVSTKRNLKPWKFTFGLQATPVKPLPGDWRRWRVSPGGFPSFPINEKDWLNPANKNVHIIWATPDVMPYYGYPQGNAKLKSTVASLHAMGAKAIPYTLINAIAANAPEGKAYAGAWGNDAVFGKEKFSDAGAFDAGLLGMTPTRDWADFIAWSCDRYLRDNDLDGLYHDMTHVLPTSNTGAGFGYTRDGKTRRSYPIFAQREVYKRIYTLMKQYGAERGKETFMLAHTSTNIVMPVLGFCDAYLDGEDFYAQGVKDNYLDYVTLAGLRAEYMGRNQGAMPYFLPKLNRSKFGVGPTRNLMGLALLHDFQLWPLWSNAAEVHRVYGALDAFGIADAELQGYWNNTRLVGGQTSGIKCTVYRKSNGATMLCVFNTARQADQVRLTLDASLFAGAHTVVDALDGKPVALQGNSITVEVAPLDFRLLVTR